MSEVRAPPSAAGLCADHAVSTVFVFFDFALICGFEKTWPSRARIELCRGVEQRLSAADAVIGPRVFCLPVLAGKIGLSPRLARHMILLRGELLFPLRLFLFHLFCHERKSSRKKFLPRVFQLLDVPQPRKWRLTACASLAGDIRHNRAVTSDLV